MNVISDHTITFTQILSFVALNDCPGGRHRFLLWVKDKVGETKLIIEYEKEKKNHKNCLMNGISYHVGGKYYEHIVHDKHVGPAGN